MLYIYVGRQIIGPGARLPADPLVAAEMGKADGVNAVALVVSLGAPRGSTIVLDIENGPPLVDPMKSYAVAWAMAVQGATTVDGAPSGYLAGAYCSHLFAQELFDTMLAAGVESPALWVFRLTEQDEVTEDPGDSGFGAALAWQYKQNTMIKNIMVDLSVARYADPSAP
jgi:hypothetical protein